MLSASPVTCHIYPPFAASETGIIRGKAFCSQAALWLELLSTDCQWSGWKYSSYYHKHHSLPLYIRHGVDMDQCTSAKWMKSTRECFCVFFFFPPTLVIFFLKVSSSLYFFLCFLLVSLGASLYLVWSLLLKGIQIMLPFKRIGHLFMLKMTQLWEIFCLIKKKKRKEET